jgi:rubrerythrin
MSTKEENKRKRTGGNCGGVPNGDWKELEDYFNSRTGNDELKQNVYCVECCISHRKDEDCPICGRIYH